MFDWITKPYVMWSILDDISCTLCAVLFFALVITLATNLITKNEKKNRMSECNNCDKYDYQTHSCPIFCDVIRNTLDDVRADERAKTIEEYKNKVWEDIETRYKNDIKILGYLSAQNLLKDVHNSICYFAEQMKGDKE